MTDKTQRWYTAYGLVVKSEIPLDEFAEIDARQPDVLVEYGDGGWTSPVPERGDKIEIRPSHASFWLEQGGGFSVESGRRIVVYPNPEASAGLLRLYVEGMLLAMVLHQRGMCVLHASVIDIDGVSIALMGHVGAGKSSLAGALYARGHRVLSDDNAAIEVSEAPPAVTPAYPYVKLFPAIASLLGFHNGSLRTLHPLQGKMAGAVTKGFANSPSPLSRIYVLGRDHQPEVRRLTPLEATVELIRNAVPTRWGHAGDAGQLQRCATVARQVPVFAVRTFTHLDGLPEVASALEQHCCE